MIQGYSVGIIKGFMSPNDIREPDYQKGDDSLERILELNGVIAEETS